MQSTNGGGDVQRGRSDEAMMVVKSRIFRRWEITTRRLPPYRAPTPTRNMADVKPDVKVVTIEIRDQEGNKTFFKVKKSTRMGKVFKAYAKKLGVEVISRRFQLNGERINNESVGELELEDGDWIDALLEQDGGGRTEVDLDGALAPVRS